MKLRDEFLSEEDIDLRNMSEQELIAYWSLWLEQAQATNDKDRRLYSHGVFTEEPIADVLAVSSGYTNERSSHCLW